MLSPPNQRPSRISISSSVQIDRSIIIPDKPNWTSSIYKTKPAYVATKITTPDIHDEHKPATTLVLSQINEEKNNETDDFEAFTSVNGNLESRRKRDKETNNIFKRENLLSPKYQEYRKGLDFTADGLPKKHCIVGSSEVFERYQRNIKRLTIRESVILSAQELPNFDRTGSRVFKKMGTVVEQNSSANQQLTNSGLQAKKQGTFEKKKEIKEIKMSKDELYTKLDDLRKSQKTFYQQDQKKLQNLPLGDQLYHTKQVRCLEKYENTLNNWNTTISSIIQRVKRPINKSVMMRAEDFRKKVEEAELFDLAQTGAERLGSSYWSASLRNSSLDVNPSFKGHTRFKSSEDLRPLSTVETIRTPFGVTKSSTSNFPTIGDNRSLDRTKIEYLTEKTNSIAKDLRKIRPHVATNMEEIMIEGRNKLELEVTAFFNKTKPIKNSYFVSKQFIERQQTEPEECIVQNYSQKEIIKNGLDAFMSI